jgi:cytochrome c-type biogenesis protein CcmH/NrfF
MRSRKMLTKLLTAVVLGSIILSGCGGADEETAQESVAVDGETLLQDRCTQCHGLDRVTSQEKTRAEWEQTVEEMIDQGAELNEDEKIVLVDYLAASYGP